MAGANAALTHYGVLLRRSRNWTLRDQRFGAETINHVSENVMSSFKVALIVLDCLP